MNIVSCGGGRKINIFKITIGICSAANKPFKSEAERYRAIIPIDSHGGTSLRHLPIKTDLVLKKEPQRYFPTDQGQVFMGFIHGDCNFVLTIFKRVTVC